MTVQQLWQYQEMVVGIPTTQAPETPQVDKFGQPTNQPTRNFAVQKVFKASQISYSPSSWIDTKQLTLAETTQVDKWFQPTAQPRFDVKRLQYLYPSLFVDSRQLTQAEQVQADKFVQPTNQPRFDIKRQQWLYPNTFLDSKQLTLSEQVQADKFVQPTNQPRFDLRRQQWLYPPSFIDSRVLTQPENVLADKFVPPTSQPRFDIKKTQHLYQNFANDNFQVVNGAEVITMDKWFMPYQMAYRRSAFSPALYNVSFTPFIPTTITTTLPYYTGDNATAKRLMKLGW